MTVSSARLKPHCGSGDRSELPALDPVLLLEEDGMRAIVIGSVCLVLGLAGCASGRSNSDVELSFGDGSLEFEVSKDLVVSLLGEGLGSPLECGGDPDPDLRRLLAPLDGKRSGSTRIGAGSDQIRATRRGSRLTLEVGTGDTGRLTATVPWAVGECLLGRSITLDEALGNGAIRFELETGDGKVVKGTVR
jgi:hypothetical protein